MVIESIQAIESRVNDALSTDAINNSLFLRTWFISECVFTSEHTKLKEDMEATLRNAEFSKRNYAGVM